MSDSDSTASGSGELPKAPPITGMPAPQAGDLAGYGLRVVGYLVDGLLVGVLGSLIIYFAISRSSVVMGILGALAGLLYGALLIGGWGGQTVGMKLVGIRCVMAADRAAVPWATAWLRAFVAAVFQVLWIVGLVDLLWPLWDKDNQTLHDKVAQTVVVRT